MGVHDRSYRASTLALLGAWQLPKLHDSTWCKQQRGELQAPSRECDWWHLGHRRKHRGSRADRHDGCCKEGVRIQGGGLPGRGVKQGCMFVEPVFFILLVVVVVIVVQWDKRCRGNAVPSSWHCHQQLQGGIMVLVWLQLFAQQV